MTTRPTCDGLRSVGSKETEEAIAQLERLSTRAAQAIAVIRCSGLVYDPKYNVGENTFRIGEFTIHDGGSQSDCTQ